MTKRWMVGAAAMALAAATGGVAHAADLSTRNYGRAPVFVSPPFTWTGFYIGANAGGAWATGNTTIHPFYPAADSYSGSYYAGYLPGSLNTGASGFIGGGQAGFNFQDGGAVFGIETDFDGTSLSRSRGWTGNSFGAASPLFPPTDYFTANATARLNWLGTTRARIGFVATPDNRLMVYGTGGVAYGSGSVHGTIYDFDNLVGWYGASSSTRVGWTIGAGAEYAITNNVTLKGEYLYYNLGAANTIISPLTGFVGYPFVTGTSAIAKTIFEGSILRAGVNVKF
jgi:outer membrane immunogenic protein